ncbi:hypothetical protein T458_18970 [Brevibacillus panacihumi W25]|uniref:Branched-chain amino acid ABC transporter permease n=1 Tax=Brevibacillus panacihumi W25 TaxID=1408254 RepID=V6M7J5_9BACL|nr:AzlC family ABC transporter permease [Brevibacillus panacihumi]EST53865.1 hypothetical protein T458_18970 [Brevibacillus panacihumi W25]
MNRTQSSLSLFRVGFWDALPITASYILFGAIFGMMALQTGLTSWESVAMSIFVYSGAAQFSAISMLADNAGMWAILITTVLLNTRHFLMGLSLSPYYQRFSFGQVTGLAFYMTDEQYAVTLNRFRHYPSQLPYILGVSLSLHAAWVFGTWIGTVAGQWIPDPASLGLGFSFTAMFLALAYYQLTSWLRILTFILCGALAVYLSLLLPNGLHLLIAGLVAFGVGYLLPDQKATAPPHSDDAAAKGVESA